MSSTEADAQPLFRRHVRRPRLTAILDESTAQAIVLNAPAGYGKTTVANEWLPERDDVVWYRATSASADVAAFSVGLADALQKVCPGAGSRLRQRIRVTSAPDRAVRTLAELLADDLMDWPTGAWLVIDDYHMVMESEPVEDFVDWLLTLTPIRLLVTTRRRPRWASARRILYGEITEVTREQLAMTPHEALTVMGEHPSRSAAAITKSAAGWPALIGLAAIAVSSELPDARVSHALYRYFADEVLKQQPPDLHDFLLCISVPDHFDAALAAEITRNRDTRQKLDALVERGLVDEGPRQTHQLHPLLRDFLRARFRDTAPGQFVAVSEAVVGRAREACDWEQAFDVANVAGLTASAAEIVGDAAPQLLEEGRIETLEKWLQAVCQRHQSDTPVQLARIELLTRQGKLAEAYLAGQSLLGTLDVDDHGTSRAMFLLGQAAHLASRYDAALGFHQRALDAAMNEVDERNARWGIFLSVAELECGDLDQHIAPIERIAAADLNAQLRVASARQMAAARRGSFAGVWAQVSGLVTLVDAASDPMARTNFLAGAAYVSIGRGEYATAVEFATRALLACTELRLDFAIGYCIVLRGAAEAGLGDSQAATRTLREAEALARKHEDPHLRLEVDILEIKIAFLRGSATPERRAHENVPAAALGEYVALHAIAAAARRRREEAAALSAEVRRLTRSAPAGIYLRLVAAILALDGAHSRAEQIVERAVRKAASAEVLDSVIIACRACRPLLARIRMLDFVDVVGMGRFTVTPDSMVGDGGDTRNPYGLTARELEVLLLMREGLSNAGIAERLVISTSTAKVHVHHILEKMRASTRVEAVVRAVGDEK